MLNNKQFLIKVYTYIHCLTGCLISRMSHQSSRRLHLILTSTSNNNHLLVYSAHLVNSGSFHYNKPRCYANIDMLEVPEQIEAVLAKALSHLSKLSAHIRCETTVAISLLATRSCAAENDGCGPHFIALLSEKTQIYQQR